MESVSERIASLSPAQRELLLQRIKQRKRATQPNLPISFDPAAEAVLDPTIRPDGLPLAKIFNPDAILLTGGTGFLGAFLLADLLQQTQATIYCLVRAATREEGKSRLKRNMESYFVWKKQFSKRIVPVLGDLSRPLFGLDEGVFETLASRVDVIYHSGASLNFMFPYVALKPINVLGTENILRLACQVKLKLVHHISSLSVFESSAYENQVIDESNSLEHGEGMFLAYAQSKWVAEKLALIARSRGVPICIYRLPFLSGHSRTGASNPKDFNCLMTKGCLQMGIAPYIDYGDMMATVPVDYPSRAIAYLSQQPDSIGKNFHLSNPRPVPIKQTAAWSRVWGDMVQYVPYSEWQTQLERTVVSPDHPLYALRPFFLQKWSSQQLTIPDLYVRSRSPKVDCQATLAALAKTGIRCEPHNPWLMITYMAFLLKIKFLDSSQIGRGRALLIKFLALIRRYMP